MIKFKNFALRWPFLFGFVLLLIYTLLGTLTYPVHFLFPATEVGQLYGDALAKFIIFLVFLFILWGFGWIKTSGITQLGKSKIWLIVVVILIYKIFAMLYAFTGDLSLAFPKSQLGLANLVVNLPTSLVEETMYRALALVAMMIVWGNTKKGQLKAIFFSSLYFGLTHLFNLMVRPFGVVFFQATMLIFQGMIYAVLVLSFRSLWPSIIIHWLSNAVVNIKVIGYENYQESLSMWVIYAVSLIPLLVYSLYLFRKLPETYPPEIAEAG